MTHKEQFLAFMAQCWDASEKSVEKHGAERQVRKAIEEMAEFIAELSKEDIKSSDVNVASEHADVLIVMAQLSWMCSQSYVSWELLQQAVTDKFEKWMDTLA